MGNKDIIRICENIDKKTEEIREKRRMTFNQWKDYETLTKLHSSFFTVQFNSIFMFYSINYT